MVRVIINASAVVTAHPDMMRVAIMESEDFSTNESYVSANGTYHKDEKSDLL